MKPNNELYNQNYFSIDRKTLKIEQTNLFRYLVNNQLDRFQDNSMSEASRIVNSCKLVEPEDIMKKLPKTAEKIRIEYENSIKY